MTRQTADRLARIATRWRRRPASPDEFESRVARLEAAADWAELWQLSLDASPVAAIGLAARFPRDWRPATERDETLLLAIRADLAASLAAAALVREASRTGRITPMGHSLLGGTPEVFRAVFSHDREDECWLTVVAGGDRFSRWSNCVVNAYDQRGTMRWLAAEYIDQESVGPPPYALAGAGCAVYANRTEKMEWVGVSSGSAAADLIISGVCGQPQPVPTGIVFATVGGIAVKHSAAHSSQGGVRVLATASAAGISPYRGEPPLLAADLGTGRLAVEGLQLRLLSPDGKRIARETGDAGHITDLAFDGPDRLISLDVAGALVIRIRRGRRLVESARVDVGRSASGGTGFRLAVFPVSRQIVVDGHTWLSADTLRPTPPIPGLDVPDRARVVASPTGYYSAVVEKAAVTIYQLRPPRWVELLDTPMAAATRNDLDALPDEAQVDPDAVGALHLLRECLAYRFGADLAVNPDRDESDAEHN